MVPVNVSTCQSAGGIIYLDKCFEAFNVGSGLNWLAANDNCRNNGGYLAIISSSNENNAVRGLVSSGNAYWIGGDDRYVEGSYIWTDGSAFVFTNWTSGAPVVNASRDCLEVINTTSDS